MTAKGPQYDTSMESWAVLGLIKHEQVSYSKGVTTVEIMREFNLTRTEVDSILSEWKLYESVECIYDPTSVGRPHRWICTF